MKAAKRAVTLALSLVALVGLVSACGASMQPPAGCPDTAPASLSGTVSAKQSDASGPQITASNGDECWQLMISNRTLSGNLISVYVSRSAYNSLEVGDQFRREWTGL